MIDLHLFDTLFLDSSWIRGKYLDTFWSCKQSTVCEADFNIVSKMAPNSNYTDPTTEILILVSWELEIHTSQSKCEVVPCGLDKLVIGRSRKVRFSEDVDRKIIPNKREMSLRQKRCYWYQHSDYRRMRKEQPRRLRMQGLSGDEEELEELSSRFYSRQRGLQKVMAQYYVLDEQERQFKMGISDPHLIAQIYKEFSSRCHLSTFMAALAMREEKRKKRNRALNMIDTVWKQRSFEIKWDADVPWRVAENKKCSIEETMGFESEKKFNLLVDLLVQL